MVPAHFGKGFSKLIAQTPLGVFRMCREALRIFIFVLGTIIWLEVGPNRAGAG